MDFLQIVMTPFTWLLTRLYFLFAENYGLALIVFAIIIKVILFPLAVKGKRGMIQMNMISGKQAELQKKYANDKMKLNEELDKLYKKEGVDRTGGCLWTMLPMLLLFPLFAVVRRPLRYLMGLSDTAIAAVMTALEPFGIAAGGYAEINAANAFTILPGALEAAKAAVGAGADKLFAMNFFTLGLDLSATPTWNVFAPGFVWNWASIGLLLIPILSAVSSLLSSRVIQKTSQMGGQAPQNNMMLTLMGPVMSLWFGFTMPAGIGVYWITSNLLSMVQEIIAGNILKEDYAKAAAAKAEQARLEKEEEKRAKAEKAARIAEEKLKPKAKQRPPERKENASEASRVGLRAYARGRAYDPARYGGVTEYRDPFAPVDEAAVEAARAGKGLPEDEPVPELAADIPDETTTSLAAPEETAPDETAAPEEAAPEADGTSDTKEE